MPYTRTHVTTDVSIEAKVTFFDPCAFILPPDEVPPYGSTQYNRSLVEIGTPVGIAQYWVEAYSGPPPYEYLVYFYGSVSGPEATMVTDRVLIGTVLSPSPPDPAVVEVDSEAIAYCRGSFEDLYLHKMRDASRKPSIPAGPCHPLHFGMKYAWANPDGASLLIDSGVGAARSSETLALGPFTDLGGVSFSLGMSHGTQGYIPTGLCLEVSEAKLRCGDLALDLNFDGFYQSGPGARIEGAGNSLRYIVEDPRLDCPTWSAGVALPTIIDFDLRGHDWRRAMPARFSIPTNTQQADGSYTEVVTSPFKKRRTYWAKSWGGPWHRPFSVAPPLDAEWAEADLEDVDPPDLRCTLEESDLSLDPENTWAHFPVRRTPSLSVQLPEDAGGALPSAWLAQAEGVTVDQSGKVTHITVAPEVQSGAVKRTLREDYFRFYLTGDGIAAYSIPGNYRTLKHLPGSDIWNWENYQFLRLEYQSERDATLMLTLDYSEVSISDNHLTGQIRVDEFSYDRRPAQVAYKVPIRTTSGETTQKVVVDLALPENLKLQHVDAITLGGFAGGEGAPWTFKIHEFEIRRFNPTKGSATGHTTCKITFNRPDEDGFPISYTGFTATAEGDRCCRPPDQIKTLCGEEGMDFVELLTGAESGIALDFMRPLGDWYGELARQEGWEVDDQGQHLPTSAVYRAAFVDAKGNDMLGGLYTGDLVESIEKVIRTGEQEDVWALLEARPRVGGIDLVSGYPIDCKIDKILHGGAHGRVNTADGLRAGPDEEVLLYEGGVGPIEVMTTDDWGRFFSNLGCGELREDPPILGIAVGTEDNPPTVYLDIYNTLRRWFQTVGQSSDRLDAARISDGDILTVVHVLAGNIVRQTTYNAGSDWTAPEVLVEKAAGPAVIHASASFGFGSDSDRFWVFFHQEGELKLRRPDGTIQVLLPGMTHPSVFELAYGEAGRLGVLAHSAGSLWFLPLYWDGTTFQPDLSLAVSVGAALGQAGDGLTTPDGVLHALAPAPDQSARMYRSEDHGRTWAEEGDLSGIPEGASHFCFLGLVNGELGRLGVLFLRRPEEESAYHLWYTALVSDPVAEWIVDQALPPVDLGPARRGNGDLKDLVDGRLLALFKDLSGAVAVRRSEDQGRTYH